MKMPCPLCLSNETQEFYWQENVPVHSNAIYDTPSKAINCPKGTISLVASNCGLVFNSRFNNDLLEYHMNYDNCRTYSRHYRDYIASLIQALKGKVEIKGKRILEIGSGNGEFLIMLCEECNSVGIGIDPAYKGETQVRSITFISDYFDERYSGTRADVIVLRHILEHIDNAGQFLASILHNVHSDTGNLTLVIEVPSFEWIAEQGAWWDISYEHCNYFTREALKNLLELNKAHTRETFNTFSDQYLVAIGESNTAISSRETQGAIVTKTVSKFTSAIVEKKRQIDSMVSEIDGLFTIWGVAGKGVNFINSLSKEDQSRIPFVIDINKGKQGKYCPGTGHKIVAPSVLGQEKDLENIIITNPTYYDEISHSLEGYSRDFSLTVI